MTQQDSYRRRTVLKAAVGAALPIGLGGCIDEAPEGGPGSATETHTTAPGTGEPDTPTERYITHTDGHDTAVDRPEPDTPGSPTPTESGTTRTEAPPTVEIRNSEMAVEGETATVTGEAVSLTDATLPTVEVRVVVYGADGETAGTGRAVLSDLTPGEPVAFAVDVTVPAGGDYRYLVLTDQGA